MPGGKPVPPDALCGPLPPEFWHVVVEAVTVASTEYEAKQRVSRWLAEGRKGVQGWVRVRRQSEEIPP